MALSSFADTTKKADNDGPIFKLWQSLYVTRTLLNTNLIISLEKLFLMYFKFATANYNSASNSPTNNSNVLVLNILPCDTNILNVCSSEIFNI